MDAPRLWFDDATRRDLRSRTAAGEPLLAAIAGLSRNQVAEATDKDHADRISAAWLAWLDDDPTAAGAAARAAAERADPSQCWPSDLRIASWCRMVALVHECVVGLAPAADLMALRARARQLCLRLATMVTSGNPHQVGNNWWAVTHSGIVHSGLVAGHDPVVAEAVARAAGRLSAFCHHFGDRGLYHEGLGYQAYTCAHLLPAVLALRSAGIVDLPARFPNLAQMAESYLASVCARPATTDVAGQERSFGAQLSWNDSGAAYASGCELPCMLALAPAERQGALRGAWDRLHGLEGSGQLVAGGGHLLLAAYYPHHVAPVAPDGVLTRFVCDARQGLVIARSGWRGAEDALVGAYARATHVGGHQAEDAGSVRLMALGHDWLLGAGQARPAAEYQSVVTRVERQKPKPNPCAKVIWAEATTAGMQFGLDLRQVHGCYSERYVAAALDGSAGAPVVLALLDQLDDHHDDSPGWWWQITHEPGLAVVVHDDGAGFDCRADDGAIARWRFLGNRPQEIMTDAMPTSSRTFSSGESQDYPGRPLVRARFAATRPLGILTVATIGTGEPPAARRGDGVDLVIGDTTWRRPFAAAVPADFTPGVSRGLCPWPSGSEPA